MAQSNGAKPVQKTTVSWFEFLFDTTGDLMKKHLGEASAGLWHLFFFFRFVLSSKTLQFV